MTEGVVGVLLAGGLSRRMGGKGDKPLHRLCGEPLLGHTIARARPQVAALVLNVNAAQDRFAEYGLPLVADPVEGFVGPLAGVLAGMEWARRERPDCPWVMSFATDAPFIPRDLVARLAEAVAAEGADIGCAMSGGRTHPVFALWPVRLADELRRALVEEGMRKIDRWTARYRVAHAAWPAEPVDPFFNVNTAEDLAEAERFAAVPDKMRLGVVVERRPSASPWGEAVWRPVEVIPGGPETDAWRPLGDAGGVARWYTGALTLELFRRETVGYRENLSAATPMVYVVLRPASRDGHDVMAPFHVTVCPHEAAAYQISGDEVVEGVPMPEAVGALVQAFVDRFHVDEPFVKRKLKPNTVDSHGRS